MPDTCCVSGCPNVGTHGGVIRYFSLPQVIENKGEEIKKLSCLRREKWIACVKVKKPEWEPQKHSKICSFHFVSGSRASLTDSNSPDWVPSLFLGTSNEDKQNESESITLIKGLVAKKKMETHRSMITVVDRPMTVYMLGSTHRRWKEVKDALTLESDDALANYLLNLFEAGLPYDSKASEPATSTSSEASTTPEVISLKVKTIRRSQSDTPDEMTVSDKSQLDSSQSASPPATAESTCTESEDTTQLPSDCQPSDGCEMEDNGKPQEETTNDTTSSISDVMATGSPTDIIDIPLMQPIHIPIKKEKSDAHESPKTKPKSASSDSQGKSTSASETKVSRSSKTKDATEKVKLLWIPPNLPALKLAAEKKIFAVPEIEIDKAYLARRNNQTVAVSNHLLKSLSYQCNKCRKKFSDPRMLETHKLEVHGMVDKYKCRHCCITYKNRRGLTRHMSRDHPGPANKPFCCSACDKSFEDREEMIKHQKVHSDACNNQCEFCPRKFVDSKKCQKHQSELHVKNPDGTVNHTGFLCEKCNSVYATRNALSAHESQNCEGWHELLNSTLTCPQCQKSFENARVLEQHLIDVHSTEIKLGAMKFGETNAKGVMVCACGKVLVGRNAIVVHKCPQRKKCPNCEKTFKHNISLRQHMEVAHTEEKPEYKCKICQRVYSRIHNLRAHEKIHKEGRQRYKCRYCPKAYTSKQTVREHELKHNGIRSLCSVCGKGFATPTILNTHMRVHTRNKKYQCSYCNKKFFDGYTMRCHVNSHTGNRPLKCKYCDKTFVFASSRSLHQRTQHPTQHYADRAKSQLSNYLPEEEMEALSKESEGEASQGETQGPPQDDSVALEELQRLSKELETDGALDLSLQN